jgi:hypothetical protein
MGENSTLRSVVKWTVILSIVFSVVNSEIQKGKNFFKTYFYTSKV